MIDLRLRIHSLFFLATPHRGANLATTLKNMLQISQNTKPFVTELQLNSEAISSINDSFRHVADDLQLWSFYETLKTNLYMTRMIIVDESSAVLGYPRERTFSLNSDHRGVCKFVHRNDPNYLILRNSFIESIDNISFISKCASNMTSGFAYNSQSPQTQKTLYNTKIITCINQ